MLELLDENINMDFLSDRLLAEARTQSKRHPGTIRSHRGIGIHPHVYNFDNPGTNTHITGLDAYFPARCENPNPTGRSLIGLGSYVEPSPPWEDGIPPPVQRSFHISKTSPNRERKLSYLGSTPPRTVWKPQSRLLITDWFKLHSAALGG